MHQQKKEKIFWYLFWILCGILFIVLSMFLSYENIEKEKFSLGYLLKHLFISAFTTIIILIYPTQLILRFFIKNSKLKIEAGYGLIVGLIMFIIPFRFLIELLNYLKRDNKLDLEIISVLFIIENAILLALLTRYIYKKMYHSY
jgi:hypothetical protein